MKWFLNIFLLYFTVIAFIPCSDGACSHEATPTSNACTEINYDTQNHNHEDNCCPPFCYCSCCGTSITFSEEKRDLEEVPPVLISESENNFYYTHNIGNLFHAIIWQPPRFC